MSNLHHELQPGLAPAAANRPAPTAPQAIGRVGIVGATASGMAIALNLVDAGIPVTVFELERATLDLEFAKAHLASDAALARGRRSGLLAGTVNFHHLKDCDLVIEAVSTDLAAIGELFRRLDQTVKQGAMLVTCTAPSRVEQLAACTRRMGEVLGLHLSRPAHVGETWTLIPGKASAGPSLATMVALAQSLGKACVVSGSWSADVDQGGSTRSWRIDQAQE